MKIKVLNLCWWMTYFTDDNRFKKSRPELKETAPVFHRNGYYLLDKRCWFEFDGRAWDYDSSSFTEDLALLSMPVFREVEYEALRVLNNAGLLTDELKINLQWHNQFYCKRRRRELAGTLKRRNALKKKYGLTTKVIKR